MKQPGLYKFFLVVGIILGGFGTMNGLFGTIAAVTPGFNKLGSTFMDQMAQSPELKKELRSNIEFQKSIEAIMDRWRPYTGGVAFLGLLTSIFLLISSIGLMKVKPRAPSRFRWACLASMPKTIASTVVSLMLQSETIATANSWMQELFTEAQVDQPTQFMNSFINIIKAGAMVFSVFLTVLVLTYYIGGIIYMGRDSVKKLYAGKAAAEATAGAEGS